MQLFIKVVEAVTVGQPGTAVPKFHHVITNCEFSLLQALENVVGGDLVYYEIVGPGSWAIWTTLAKELKKPLLHEHVSALCRLPTRGPAAVVALGSVRSKKKNYNDDDCPIVLESSCKGQQLTLLHHSQPVSQTRQALCEHMETDTQLKKPVMSQNIPANAGAIYSEETHVKVLECTQIEDLKYSQEPSLQVSNSNNLEHSGSLDNMRGCLGSLSVEGPTKTLSHPSLDSKDYVFTPDQHSQIKAMTVGELNTSEYVHVVKHFPDKLLYKDSNSKGNNQDLMALQVHPMEVLENVPHLSLLEEGFSCLPQNIQRSTLHIMLEEKNIKLNNLNCGTPFSVKSSVNSQTIPKASDSATAANAVEMKPAQKDSQTRGSLYSSTRVGDPVIQTPVISEANISDSGTSTAAYSMFTEGRSAQHVDTSVFSAGDGYIPHTCIQPLGRKLKNIGAVEGADPLPSGNSGLGLMPPPKIHRLGHNTPSSLLPAEQQSHNYYQLQQQALLEVQASKQQQALASQQATASSIDLSSAIDSQQHQPWSEQRRYALFHDGKVCHHHHHQQEQQQQGNYPKQNSSSEHSSGQKHQELENQTFHLMDTSEPPVQYHQQLNTQHFSQQEIQSSTSPFLKSTASHFLICHTPPPGFPDEQARNEHQETNPASHFVGKLGHVTKMNTGMEQYIAMSQPTPNGNGNSCNKAAFVRSQTLGQFTLQNNDFSKKNRIDPQAFLQSGNQFGSAFSSSSSGGSPCAQSKPPGVFTEGQNSFMSPQPFHPAAPLFDALGRRIHVSVNTNNETSQTDVGPAVPSSQEGFHCTHNGHFSTSKPTPSNHLKAMPTTHVLRLEDELLHLDGWCPHENGDTIQHTLEKYRSQDGNYIIWKSRRHQKFIISVSYLNQLFHFRIEEIKPENSDGTIYYMFEGGYTSHSLLDLLHHYQQNGIRVSMHPTGRKKTYNENIKLCCALKVKADMKKKDISKSK